MEGITQIKAIDGRTATRARHTRHTTGVSRAGDPRLTQTLPTTLSL